MSRILERTLGIDRFDVLLNGDVFNKSTRPFVEFKIGSSHSINSTSLRSSSSVYLTLVEDLSLTFSKPNVILTIGEIGLGEDGTPEGPGEATVSFSKKKINKTYDK